MKIRVKVQDRQFEVEVGDLHAQPIQATIDGETFEVWLEEEAAPIPPPVAQANGKAPLIIPVQNKATNGNAVYAPIPGVIVAVVVKPGEQVSAGQKLCTLEAMKMENVIYATRAGEIATIHVSPGQQVKHHDTLMEFA